MAGKTNVTKGYSTYTDIPAPRPAAGYDHGPRKPDNQYVVEPKMVNRIRTPAPGYTDLGGSPSKMELLKEYVHSPSIVEPNGLNYESSRWPVKTSSYSSKYRPTSPVRGFVSEDAHVVRLGPGLEGDRDVRTGKFPGPNKSWQSAGPRATRHPLTTPTNNINEALGLLEESVNHSSRSDTRRRGVLDELSNRAQPVEPHRRYARPAFVAKLNDSRYGSGNTGNGVDSQEGARRYRGAFMS